MEIGNHKLKRKKAAAALLPSIVLFFACVFGEGKPPLMIPDDVPSIFAAPPLSVSLTPAGTGKTADPGDPDAEPAQLKWVKAPTPLLFEFFVPAKDARPGFYLGLDRPPKICAG